MVQYDQVRSDGYEVKCNNEVKNDHEVKSYENDIYGVLNGQK